MPIPKPKKNETENMYVSRCFVAIKGYHSDKEALAICYDTYKKSRT